MKKQERFALDEVEKQIFERFGIKPNKKNFDDICNADRLLYRLKETDIEIHVSNYYKSSKEFIDFSWSRKKGIEGGGRPCDSYEEVLEHMEKYIGKLGNVQVSLF